MWRYIHIFDLHIFIKSLVRYHIITTDNKNEVRSNHVTIEKHACNYDNNSRNYLVTICAICLDCHTPFLVLLSFPDSDAIFSYCTYIGPTIG